MAIVTPAEVLESLQIDGSTIPTAGNTWIVRSIARVQDLVEDFLKWKVEQATYTEYYPNNQQQSLVSGDELISGWDLIGSTVVGRERGDLSHAALPLKRVPVRSITSVYENVAAWDTDGGSWTSSHLLAATSYYLDLDESGYSYSGILYKNTGVWCRKPRTIKVTYVAGFTAGEIESQFPKIKMAMCMAVGAWYVETMAMSKAAQAGGPLASVGIKDFNVSFQGIGAMMAMGELPPGVKAMLSDHINFNGLM